MGLLEKLKAGKKNIKVLKFPGTEEDIGLSVLTEFETQEAVFAAERRFNDAGIEITATTLGVYNAEVNVQLLFLTMTNPSGGKSPFKDAGELRGLLTRESRNILVDEYNAWEDECNPSPLRMSDDDFEKLFGALKKNAGASGSDLSLRTLRGLITYLACRETKSPPASGSIS